MDLKLGGSFGYWLLCKISKSPQAVEQGDAAPVDAAQAGAKLERLLGNDVWRHIEGRRVLDFGCGHGAEAIAAAQHGAEFVWGIDIQEHRLEAARSRAREAGVQDRCVFLNAATDAAEIASLQGTIDCAYSIDAFEHYARPDEILQQIYQLLAPGGELLISFGPPWKNPYGCHMRYFCRWPWIHLLFDEPTILRVRARYRNDGAQRFEDVEGGLNRMTLSRFLKLVEASPFHLESLRAVPLSTRFINRRQHWHALLCHPLWREYFTSVVLCRLTRPTATDVPTSDLALAAV